MQPASPSADSSRPPFAPGGWRWMLMFGGVTAAAIGVVFWLRDRPEASQPIQLLRIGYAVEPPYAFISPDGTVSGESPEIARRIANRLGVKRVEWRLTEFGDLIHGLEAGRFDVIAAGMFVTGEREQRVSFSIPTFRARGGLLVRLGNPMRLFSVRDLVRSPKARIAVLTGSYEKKLLLQAGVDAKRLVSVPDARSGQALVESGEVDGLALSAPTLRWMATASLGARVELVDDFDDGNTTPQHGAFAFRKQDVELRRAWDAELRRFVGSPEHRALVSTFGFSAAELPPALPSEEPN